MKIGIIDLDTSHPQNWIPIERELGHEIAGLWDGGEIHPRQYVEDFAKEFAIPKIYDSLEEMAVEVDCAIIHSCNWDTHLEKARVFVDAGKAILIDKPIAGNLCDLETIASWGRCGARIAGGSSLYYCEEVRAARQTGDLDVTGKLHTILAGCGVDDFNYGIHAYALVCGAFGGGLKSVQCVGQNIQKQIRLEWMDGRAAILVIGDTGTWLPFHATFITDKTITPLIVDASKIYRALLESVLPYLSGLTSRPPVDFDVLIEAEKAALAARYSWENGNTEVQLDGLPELNVSYDGKFFAEKYRRNKYPN